MSWSYPILSRGLIYLVDINQGLLVLRYTGPHQDEVAATAFAEGNSNLRAAVAPASTPKPSLSPAAAPPSPGSHPTAKPAARRGGVGPWLLALLAVVLVAAAGAWVLHRRRGG